MISPSSLEEEIQGCLRDLEFAIESPAVVHHISQKQEEWMLYPTQAIFEFTIQGENTPT
jgi:hypothetical protein